MVAPKPTALKKLQGTYRADRAKGEAFPLVLETLDAPSILDGEAKAKWYELAETLARNGLLTECDTDALTLYCQTWARYVEAELALDTEGTTTTAQSGYKQVSPWVTISSKARADLLKLGDRLGLNPAARTRINANPKGEDEDELLA